MNYEIDATKAFIIDATKYDFSVIQKLNAGKQPELIQLFCKSGSYIIDLDTTKEILFDENSARNVGGDEKFNGLIKGEKAMIGIGSLTSNGNSVELKTFWITMIDVK